MPATRGPTNGQDGKLDSDRARAMIARRWARDNAGFDRIIERLESRTTALTEMQRARLDALAHPAGDPGE